MKWKLQNKVQEKFEKRVGELVDVEKTNVWESFEMECYRHVMK